MASIMQGQSVGGQHPDPPLHGFSLLAWMPNHPTFGADVFTEDGKASVPEVVASYRQTNDPAATARHLGTTENHVYQAIAYASLPKQSGGPS